MNSQEGKFATFKKVAFHILTPDQAAYWLQHYDFQKCQRAIKQKWVDALSREMKIGRFLNTALVTFITCKETNTEYCVNGQHTIHAVLQSQKPQEIILVHYVVDTLKQVLNYYTIIDKVLPRTVKDSLEVLNLSEELNANLSDLQKIYTAITAMTKRLRGGLNAKALIYNEHDIIALIPEWLEAYKAYKTSTRGASLRINQAEILAIKLITFRFNPYNAEIFWRGIEVGGSAPLKSVMLTVREAKLAKKFSGSGELARYIRNAWNAFIENRQIIKEEKTYLSGTEYDDIDKFKKTYLKIKEA